MHLHGGNQYDDRYPNADPNAYFRKHLSIYIKVLHLPLFWLPEGCLFWHTIL